MTTLTDYANSHFPNHATRETSGDLTLTDHTAVAHVVGSGNGLDVAERLRSSLPKIQVGTVVVQASEATVLPTGDEDTEGVVDLPARRIASAGVIGGAVAGAAVGVIVGLVTSSATIGLIVGVFAAILGGAVSAIAGGGARYGGERAWEQPNVPERTIVIVAAFAETERDASRVAELMESMDAFEVRIVAADGSWRSPNTWSAQN